MNNQPNIEDEDFVWYDYLEEQLSFPFKATISKYKEGINAGKAVKVHAIHDYDDHGFIMQCKLSRKTIYVSLLDIELPDDCNQATKEAIDLWIDHWDPY